MPRPDSTICVWAHVSGGVHACLRKPIIARPDEGVRREKVAAVRVPAELEPNTGLGTVKKRRRVVVEDDQLTRFVAAVERLREVGAKAVERRHLAGNCG